jgi:C4-dicarboxylate-specific signal transduction histidine kinase
MAMVVVMANFKLQGTDDATDRSLALSVVDYGGAQRIGVDDNGGGVKKR